MIKIEMDNGTRNYLVRVLKKYRDLVYRTCNVSKEYKKFEYEQIDTALEALLGKKQKIELDKRDSVPNTFRGWR